MKFCSLALALVLSLADGFQVPVAPVRPMVKVSPLFSSSKPGSQDPESLKPSLVKRVLSRLDTVEAAGLQDVKFSGIGDKIKKLHGPKTYLLLALMAGLKWKWCFRNPYYWFGVAFCIKWYRARYVFKIPVWDRQPNWNNIITSKDQEKDLKAFTCKNCGSTLFIAKTREFFFEGDTGIGGLGCFTCGAKGKDNFVMDRDRIVEDVADMDDYFEYERPLDFVSRAERRELMKEAGGDESKANEILLARSTSETESPSTPVDEEVNGDSSATDEEVVDAVVEEKESSEESNPETSPEVSDAGSKEEASPEPTSEEVKAKSSEDANSESTPPATTSKPKKEKKPKKKETAKKDSSPPDDDLDVLDMDSF